MKIEKITDNKIRIILNLDDLKQKNIDLHSLMSNSIESQSLFVDILDEAERTVGFYTNDSKIMIEALATSEGVFIFTITKVEEENPKKKNLKIRRKTNNNCKKAIFQFESFDEFCNYCSYINNNSNKYISIAKNQSLYVFEDNYYLIVSGIESTPSNIKSFLAITSEFAKGIHNFTSFESKLLEYGKPIMKRNAIKRCLKYFS